jgi:hypothetical protein
MLTPGRTPPREQSLFGFGVLRVGVWGLGVRGGGLGVGFLVLGFWVGVLGFWVCG